MDLLTKLIRSEKLDILALQEVKAEYIVKQIAAECEYEYYYWKKYHDCEEGLAILSKYPILETWTNWDASTDVHNSGSMVIVIEENDLKISVSNVHLDYKYSMNREVEIRKVIDQIERMKTDYNILLGDFNTYPNSSIHAYLTGRASLLEHSTRWIDLGIAHSIKNNTNPEFTIDFYNNPRWDDEPTLDLPGRFDWILLENPYPKKYPNLIEHYIIGNERVNNITPSDHYGVVCELEFD